MLPHDIQALMAKILFFIFAACLLCLPKVRAQGEVGETRFAPASMAFLHQDAQIAGGNLRAKKAL